MGSAGVPAFSVPSSRLFEYPSDSGPAEGVSCFLANEETVASRPRDEASSVSGPPGRTEEMRMPRSEAHVRLGLALRTARTRAGISTRRVPKDPLGGAYFSSGHISQVEAGATAPSPELIEAYLAMPGSPAAEIRPLYEQMLAATREAGRRRRGGGGGGGSHPVPPQDPAEVTSRHDVQQHYLVASTEAHYRFGAGGGISEVLDTVTLRAKTPGVRLYYTGFSYPADQRPGVLRIEAVSGATVVATQESSSGAVGSYFRLDRELSPHDPDPYEVRFRVAVDSSARAAPRLRYFAFGGSELFVLRAGFTPPAEPGSVWWFAVPDVVDAEHPAPGQHVDRGPGGRFEHRFERLVPGWCYGFAWAW
jgi:hypothetical protein